MAAPSTGAVSTPNKWPSREHFQGLVTLLIGTEKKPYAVHKDLLYFYSDYFRAAFQGSFKEASECKLELAGVTVDIYEHFQVWLYTRRLDPLVLDFRTIVKLWIFGDQHQIPLLQNCAIDGLFEKRVKQNMFETAVMSLAYDNTIPGSLLRKAVTEIQTSLALQVGPNSSLNETENWSVESLIDLVRAVESRPKDLAQYALPKRDKCFFHVHGKDEHC
ncbi:hypothetical protein E4T52_07564 [Aureobasidium sp. EXF-3400]|nr:hypothetical protein E4T51_06430 [Aureobasidium sp. EXF-12344]KAI4777505.1 hypothetical protein E4T52_07564 [Aureobasidium sp. EXF-3400]